eukprot:SAG31_NODE_4263_length_3399_cov_2.469394_4_plen_157_part_00
MATIDSSSAPRCCQICLGEVPTQLVALTAGESPAEICAVCADALAEAQPQAQGPLPPASPATRHVNIVHAVAAIRSCMVCDAAFDHDVARWCGGCAAVAYCSQECEDQDAATDHGRWSVDTFRYVCTFAIPHSTHLFLQVAVLGVNHFESCARGQN